MKRRRSERARIDGRALFAAPVSASPFYPLLFGPIGTIIAVASVVANGRSRRNALVIDLAEGSPVRGCSAWYW